MTWEIRLCVGVGLLGSAGRRNSGAGSDALQETAPPPPPLRLISLRREPPRSRP